MFTLIGLLVLRAQLRQFTLNVVKHNDTRCSPSVFIMHPQRGKIRDIGCRLEVKELRIMYLTRLEDQILDKLIKLLKNLNSLYHDLAVR